MPNKVPTVRQVAWISVIPHLLVMGLLTFIAWLIHAKSALILGGVTYLALSISLRRLIPKDHRKGIKAVQKEEFVNAIEHFQKSYDFFQAFPWIDKFRYLTLLSSSRLGYREMALTNIAFCFGQMGQPDQARKWFTRTLQEFPDNPMAKTGLRFFQGLEEEKQD